MGGIHVAVPMFLGDSKYYYFYVHLEVGEAFTHGVQTHYQVTTNTAYLSN